MCQPSLVPRQQIVIFKYVESTVVCYLILSAPATTASPPACHRFYLPCLLCPLFLACVTLTSLAVRKMRLVLGTRHRPTVRNHRAIKPFGKQESIKKRIILYIICFLSTTRIYIYRHRHRHRHCNR